MLVEWLAKRWAKKNLTDENIAAGARGLWGWIADKNIRQTIWSLVKYCVVEAIKTIREENEKNNAN